MCLYPFSRYFISIDSLSFFFFFKVILPFLHDELVQISSPAKCSVMNNASSSGGKFG
jgi:hypothetical protein